MREETPRYELDSDTRDLVAEVFQLAQQMIDLQISDSVSEDLQLILTEAGDRLGLPFTTISVTQDDDGKFSVDVVEDEPQPKRPTLTVIEGSKEPD